MELSDFADTDKALTLEEPRADVLLIPDDTVKVHDDDDGDEDPSDPGGRFAGPVKLVVLATAFVDIMGFSIPNPLMPYYFSTFPDFKDSQVRARGQGTEDSFVFWFVFLTALFCLPAARSLLRHPHVIILHRAIHWIHGGWCHIGSNWKTQAHPFLPVGQRCLSSLHGLCP